MCPWIHPHSATPLHTKREKFHPKKWNEMFSCECLKRQFIYFWKKRVGVLISTHTSSKYPIINIKKHYKQWSNKTVITVITNRHNVGNFSSFLLKINFNFIKKTLYIKKILLRELQSENQIPIDENGSFNKSFFFALRHTTKCYARLQSGKYYEIAFTAFSTVFISFLFLLFLLQPSSCWWCLCIKTTIHRYSKIKLKNIFSFPK